jgi:uncharacterized membrane protein (DUF485 family)
MAHFDQAAQHDGDQESKATSARNARVGLKLFVVYLTCYTAFVILTAFAAQWMRTEIAGVNVAIFAGFALIVGAFLLALVYLWLCRDSGRNTER